MTSASDHPTNESDETFALIRFEDTGPPIATFHNLRQDSQLLSGVHGYAYMRDISAAQSRIERHVSRAVSRLSCFSKQTIRRPRTSSDTHKRDGSSVASVHVGPDAFVSQFTAGKNKCMTNIFPKLSLQYSNGLSASYHVHARNVKPAGRLEPRPRSICFNTGMCLFSESLVSSLRNREDATTRAEWTLYELETMIRLSSMVADAIGLLRSDDGAGVPLVDVYVDLPDVQYYWTAFELLQQGKITNGEVQNWIKAVDTRRDEIWLRLRDLILYMLNARALAPVKVSLADGTASLRDLLIKSLKDGKFPSINESLFTLRTEGPQASSWNEFLVHMDETSRPSSTDSLSHLIHIYNTVRPALSRPTAATTCVGPWTPDRHLLLVVVDDIGEWDIFDGAKRYLQGYHAPPRKDSEVKDLGVHVVGLFPLQRIFVEDDERSSLWARCPGSRLRVNDCESLQTPAKIVEKIYGLPGVCQSPEI
jgi:hypothetical protein